MAEVTGWGRERYCRDMGGPDDCEFKSRLPGPMASHQMYRHGLKKASAPSNVKPFRRRETAPAGALDELSFLLAAAEKAIARMRAEAAQLEADAALGRQVRAAARASEEVLRVEGE